MRKIYKDKKQYRLPNYDYSADGYYFVTIVTKNRENYFGNIRNRKIQFSELGQIAYQFWQNIPDHFHYAKIDEFVIMPNHVHGIIVIQNGESNGLSIMKSNGLSTMKSNGLSTMKSNGLSTAKSNGLSIMKSNGLSTMKSNGLSTVPTIPDPSRTNGQQTVPIPNPSRARTNGRQTVPAFPSLQPQKQSLSIIIRNYKAAVTTWSRKQNKIFDIWQSRFHDRIIRNERELQNIQNYILKNPLNWEKDLEKI